MHLLLKQQDAELKRFHFSDRRTEISIGRQGFSADIPIPSPGVSRLHAQFFRDEEGSWWVIDTQSTNGTYLNGEAIKKAPFQIGDRLSFGKNQSEFYLERIEASSAEATLITSTSLLGEVDQLSPERLGELLAVQDEVSIGRKECDIILPHLTVSRKHCRVRRLNERSFEVEDLNSKNGTFVNGEQIQGKRKIAETDTIQIGKYEFTIKPSADTQRFDTNHEAVIRADALSRYVGQGERRKAILRNINLRIRPGEFVAIMGPSGSGKSTLLRALNGDAPATKGRVYIHGKDFYRNYHLLKQDIGYVPQDDIVHKKLSVHDSLFFAARLRLANDVSAEEIEKKIDEILQKLGISFIKHSLIEHISGGQRKRVSIAVELLSDPSILFLDEPTSPLDPETVEEFLKILRRLADGGTTILMVTHKPDDLDSVDKVAFLSKGGFLVYFGNTEEYLDFFDTRNVIGVYAHINQANKGATWAKQFAEQFPTDSSEKPGSEKAIAPNRQSPWRQWYWLSRRYFRAKTNDRVNTSILVLQAPILALLLIILFEKLMLQTLFLMLIAAVWLGTSNAAREIVSELAIFRRESMFNLRLLPYIFSKLVVINIFSLLQVLLLTGMIWLFVGMRHYWSHVGILFFLSFLGSLLGLFLSSVAGNADKVMSVVPLVLLPQIMLAGVIQRIYDHNEWLSYATFSRWGVEAMALIEEKAYFYYPEKIPNPAYYEALSSVSPLDTLRRVSLEDSLSRESVADSLQHYVSENLLENANMLEFPHYYDLGTCLLALSLQAVMLFGAIYISLRRKDRL